MPPIAISDTPIAEDVFVNEINPELMIMLKIMLVYIKLDGMVGFAIPIALMIKS